MKRASLLFALIVFIFAGCSSRPDLKERFKTDITSYIEAYNQGQWNKVADLIYPKLYTVSPREDLIKTMSSLDSMGMKTNIQLNSLDSVSEIVTVENEKFCLIKYHTTLNMTLKAEIADRAEGIKAGFEAQFGKENVKFDDKLNKFTVNAAQTMFAVSPKDKDEWKYIEHDQNQADYITKLIIPEEVIKKLIK